MFGPLLGRLEHVQPLLRLHVLLQGGGPQEDRGLRPGPHGRGRQLARAHEGPVIKDRSIAVMEIHVNQELRVEMLVSLNLL